MTDSRLRAITWRAALILTALFWAFILYSLS